MAAVKMKTKNNIELSLGLVLVVYALCSYALRFGEESRTIHVPHEKNHQIPSMTFFKDDYSHVSLSPNKHEREKREATTTTTTTASIDDDKKLMSVFSFNDSHEQLSVHWSGKGSKVVICLARNRKQNDGDTSRTFFSYDYGATFIEKQQTEMRLTPAKESLISMFYISPVVNSRYIFTDTVHKYIFLTKDYGKTFQNALVPFKPEVLSLHPTDADVILGIEKNDPLKKLWYSDDFGLTWKTISENVKTFFWGEKGVDQDGTLFVQRQEPGVSTSTIISTTSFFQNEQRKHILLTNVEDFEVRGKYLFATKRQHLLGSKNRNGTLQLWVSYNRKGFSMALFPNHLEKQDFYIADASEDQVFACVMHNPQITNLYISNAEGTEFSLSLERILYFSPAGAGKDLWASDIPLVDLHKIEGLRGIYIATQLREDFVSKFNQTSSLGPEETDVADGLSSVITFNKGGDWNPLRPPKTDSRGENINCQNPNCSLHVTQKFNQIYPRSKTPPILSRASAPGLVVASGVIGVSLKGHPSLFVSSDAGLNWHQVLYGNYIYSMGDHGGIVVAVEYYNEQGATDHIMYSVDEGEHWSPLKIYLNTGDKEPTKLKMYGLMTEPGEKTTVFTLFGSNPNHHQWQLIKVDFKSVFEKSCSVTDYKYWSPHGLGNSRCLLGRRDVYEKRLPHVNCYNGESYVRPTIFENCPCSRKDYECDIGFKEDSTKKCVRDRSSNFNPFRIPNPCPEDTFYNRTKGYRLVSGDFCTGRKNSGFEPDLIPCPIKDESEFLLFAQRQQISRIPLNGDGEKDETSWEKLPLEDLRNIIAVDYDFKDRCIYWGDIDEDKIMRLCLEHVHADNENETEGTPEVLVETALASVEGLAFDWVSRNLYFVDGELKKVEVIMVDLHYSGRMRRTILNSTLVDKPRGIALHPYKGYMFITDWSDNVPKLARTGLDGSDFKVLFDASVVAWPNGIAIDFQGDKIYWVDAKKDYIASSDFEGNHLKKILEGSGTVPHPFAVGVYKDWLYFDDWNRRQIVMANKYDGSGLKVIAKNVLGAMDMKVFSKATMDGTLGTNICANRTAAKCSHLCMAKPPMERNCLCPDGMIITKLSDGSENCTCPDGEKALSNGTCTSVSSTCSPDQFKCSEKTCIPIIWKCDGDNDCGDSSDELQCGTSSCDNTQFQCKNGKCIPSSWKCDVDKDCTDGSDEENCSYPSCAAGQFSCKNGHCIDKKYVCDFDDDCRDGSDESNCTSINSSCPPTEFSCLTINGGSQCLPLSWRCDGDKDCPDGSDEANCSTNTCQSWQFRCKNGRCIYSTWRCDLEDDCHDNSDEFDCDATSTTTTPKPNSTTISPMSGGTCSSWMFTCTNKVCVPYWWRCDGVDDCTDNSDEERCGDASNTTSTSIATSTTPIPKEKTCGENRFRCDSGKCIWDSWVCDNTLDCENGEDEKNCDDKAPCPEDHFHCEESSGCVPKSDVCNGKQDCGDGSDEQGCGESSTHFSVTCPSDDFTCKSGECVHFFERCDDHWDCIDGSDEEECTGVEIIHVRNLHVDFKSIKPNGFNLTWSTPTSSHGLGTKFEYMPSFHEMDSLENQWTNTTWTENNYMRLKTLVPGTKYKLTLFVRTKANPKKVFATATFTEAVTLSSAPNPPTNVTLMQNPGERTVVVKWDKPVMVSGKINQYKIYFAPPSPPALVVVPATQDTNYSINYKFTPGTNYSFWVTALSDEMESMNSHVATIVFARDAVIDPIINLTVVSKTNTSVSLSWSPPNSFDKSSKEHSNSASSQNSYGYTVSYKASYLLDNYPWTVKNTTDTKITLTGLAPGIKHVIKVSPFNAIFMGPETRLDVQTDGDPLPIVNGIKTSVKGTSITLTWNLPKDKRKTDWEYGVFIVETADSPPILANRTKANTAMLNDLDSCVLYTLEVRIIGPFGLGSSKGLIYLTTEFDKKAPPKNVNVLSIPGEGNLAKVTWDAACTEIDQDIGYKLTFFDKTMNKTSYINTKLSRQTHLEQNMTIHWGAEYVVTLQTSEIGSRPTGKIWFRAKALPRPEQVDAVPEQNGSLYIRWKEVDWPKELKDHNYTYVVLVDHDSSMSKAKLYNISKPPFVIESMQKEIPYFVAVSVRDEHGYQSQLSDISSAAYPAAAQALVFSTSNVVSVVVPIVLVIVGLAGALGFFVMRHKRLQRSFMSFANSHYDTRSGSATFTTGQDDDQLDEDDSPMIRGFSDDEPLVIA